MDPALIIFAIESAIRLGRKLNEVLLDKTQERALLLPVGRLFGDVTVADATEFFDEHKELVRTGGLYAGLSQQERVLAYKTLRRIDEQLGSDDESFAEAREIVQRLNEFEQLKKGLGARPALQRILGVVVEIGIDYFAANPAALGKDSSSRKIIHSFILRLDEVDFAEDAPVEIAGDVILAALKTLDKNVTLIDDDERLHVLLGGVTKALITDVESAGSAAEMLRRENLIKRVGSSILKGGAGAFTENIDLFLPKDTTAKALVESTLGQTLEAVRGKSDLFTNESLEIVFKRALVAVGENPQLFSEKKVLQELIKGTVTALTSRSAKNLFSEETVAAVLEQALDVVSQNVETLIDPDNPQKQLLANAVGAMTAGLSRSLAGETAARDLFSKHQLVELSRVVFDEVAKHPEQLLGGADDDERRTALAQVIGSVARSLGDDPRRLVDGAGLVELVKTALEVSVRNADKLLNLDTLTPRTNVLFQVVRQIASAVVESNDPRHLVTREVFLEIVQRVLPVVSANLAPLLERTSEPVRETIAKALDLARSGDLENRINGSNLPVLIERLLAEVLWKELNLEEETAVVISASRILRAA